MSHYLTHIIVPRGLNSEQVHAHLHEVLEPFDESIKVEPYSASCSCLQYSGGKPDPKCHSCSGSGQYETNYNPQSKWDWWQVGGRWFGLIQGTPLPTNYGSNPDDDDEVLHNIVTAESLLLLDNEAFANRAVPQAIVPLDGSWHERGGMVWFGVSDNDKPFEQWASEVRSIYEANRNHMIVACDLHI